VQCGDSVLLLLLRAGLIGSWPEQLKILVPELVFNQEKDTTGCGFTSDGEDERKVVWLVS
jgi:hypothetical protein